MKRKDLVNALLSADPAPAPSDAVDQKNRPVWRRGRCARWGSSCTVSPSKPTKPGYCASR